MKILVSGFEPFGGDDTNPSSELLVWLRKRSLPFELATIELPVSFTQAFPQLKTAIEIEKPAIVLATGLAKNRPVLTLERLGVNWIDARIPDNQGEQPRYQKIVPPGADGIFTRLPLAEMLNAAAQVGVPAVLSTSAGEYVCNQVLYLLLHTYPKLPAGFLHLPLHPDFRGVEEMLKVCYHHCIMNQ